MMAGSLARTVLYEWHKKLGAKLVPFAGWEMPLQYPSLSIIDSHLHTRKHVSLFDVSHMSQIRITGNQRLEFIESLVPSEITKLRINNAKLSVWTNEKGGIIDDCMITKQESSFFVVVNAACAKPDLQHLLQHKSTFFPNSDLEIRPLDDHALLALQGPEAAAVLSRYIKEDLTKVPFMSSFDTTIASSISAHITRCGYTGEDGFEISVLNKDAEKLANILVFENPSIVIPAGLAARDTLRLEAGLCLYGHDIDTTTTPVEAGLEFIIGPRRRKEGNFPGFEVISQQLKNGPSRRRVGFVPEGVIARENAQITDPEGNQIGKVTSGGFSPSLKKAIGMGYVKSDFASPNSSVHVIVRDKSYLAKITPLPFFPTRYYKPV